MYEQMFVQAPVGLKVKPLPDQLVLSGNKGQL
jgi:hypothetical protein